MDLVLTCTNVTDCIPLTNLRVNNSTGTSSDHFLVNFEVPVSLSTKQSASDVKEFRELSKMDIDSFKYDILSSPLHPEHSFKSLDEAVHLYNTTLTQLLDKYAPVVSRRFKSNTTDWWNTKCQAARTERRKAQRASEKFKDPESDTLYKEACIDAAIIIDRERNRYYHSKLDSLIGNPRETYKIVNHLLDKEYGKNVLPNGETDEAVANNLKQFFDTKVKNIYSDIANENANITNTCTTSSNSSGKLSSESILSSFSVISKSELIEIIESMPDKSCSLDIIPMWLFKMCLPELISVVSYIVNESLSTGTFPSLLKSAEPLLILVICL